MITDPHRFGVYRTGGLDFVNKGDALTVATLMKGTVSWHFNDEVYASFDWRVPIETPLNELYRQRALQLRERYDYVSLYFSGGVDSANILHAFIDNGILLDEVIMLKPFKQPTNQLDRTPKNVYGEIDYAAVPHLREYINDPRTVVRMIDLEASTEAYLNNHRLLDQFNKFSDMGADTMTFPSVIFTDTTWHRLYERGLNVGHIQGIDKPMIRHMNGAYWFVFDESSTAWSQCSPGTGTEVTDMLTKHHHNEFFYWTPDLPQLVIKQCQVLKKMAESNIVHKILYSVTEMPLQNRMTHIINYIYPPHVCAIRNRFCTAKQSAWGLLANHNEWLTNTTSQTQGQFKDIVTNLQTTIDDEFFVSDNNWYLNDEDHYEKITDVHSIKKFQYKFFKSRKYRL